MPFLKDKTLKHTEKRIFFNKMTDNLKNFY
jgi:hypothetical protein